MDSSSVKERDNIRNNFISKVNDKLESCQDLGEVDLYLYFNSLNKLDRKLLKEETKNRKRDLLSLRLILLKDKLREAHSLDHLDYSVEYAKGLIKEDINNYVTLQKYSKLCTSDYNVIDEARYLKFGRYCTDFSTITTSLINDIKNKPSNSSLIASIMRVEEEETYLRTNNSDTLLIINSIIDDKEKILKK